MGTIMLEDTPPKRSAISPIVQSSVIFAPPVPSTRNVTLPFYPIPAGPHHYVLLEGRTHGTYSYPDTLVAMENWGGWDWFMTHEKLTEQGMHMLTIRQFVDFLNLIKSGNAFDGKRQRVSNSKLEALYGEITNSKITVKYDEYGIVRHAGNTEWLDASFTVVDKLFDRFFGKMAMNYGHLMIDDKLTPQYNKEMLTGHLNRDTPFFSLDDWLARATYQGLPPSDIALNTAGHNVEYSRPHGKNMGAAWFGSYPADFVRQLLGLPSFSRRVLCCSQDPSNKWSPVCRVRPARVG